MVLETHMKLCMTARFSRKNFFCPQNRENWPRRKPKTGFSIIFAVFLQKSCTWENSGSWDMGQNAVNPSDCSIFKLTISLEQNDEKAWIFTCWHRFKEIKSWFKNIVMGVDKYGCGHSGLRALKLAVSQEGISRVSWFLMCW